MLDVLAAALVLANPLKFTVALVCIALCVLYLSQSSRKGKEVRNSLRIRRDDIVRVNDREFMEAVITLRSPFARSNLSFMQNLKSFALMKQGLEGDCLVGYPWRSFDFSVFAKVFSWGSLRGMTQKEARKNLVNFVNAWEGKSKAQLYRFDTHQHIVPPFYAQAVKEESNYSQNFVPPWSVELAKQNMKLMGIRVAMMSVSVPGPLVYQHDWKKCKELARKLNSYVYNVVSKEPSRFGYFASIPHLCDTKGAIEEMEYAYDNLGANGICVFTSYKHEGEYCYLGHPSIRPFWEQLSKRENPVVFIHPIEGPVPQANSRLIGALIDYPNETARTAADLVLSGVITAYPNINFILSHAGGTLPFLHGRIALTGLFLNLGSISEEEIEKGLRSFYYDVAIGTTPEQLQALLKLAAPDHILFGSDVPYLPKLMAYDYTCLLDSFFSKGKKQEKHTLDQINFQNALSLFPNHKNLFK